MSKRGGNRKDRQHEAQMHKAKPKMVHKPLVKEWEKQGKQPPGAAGFIDVSETVVARAKPVAAQAPAPAALPELDAKIKGMIEGLKTAVDPDGMAEQIARLIGRRLGRDPDALAMIEANLVEGHVNRVIRNVEALPTHRAPAVLVRQIDASWNVAIGHGRAVEIYHHFNTSNASAFFKHVEDQRAGGVERIAEEKRVQWILDINGILSGLAIAAYNGSLPVSELDRARETIADRLTQLGPRHAHRACPDNAKTEKELLAHVEDLHDQAAKRWNYLVKRVSLISEISRIRDIIEWMPSFAVANSVNPDDKLRRIYKSIETDLGGDVTLLASRGTIDGKTFETIKTEVEAWIDERHSASINELAEGRLHEKGIPKPFSDYSIAFLDDAEKAVAGGFYAQRFIKRHEDRNWRGLSDRDQERIGAINAIEAENWALHLAIFAHQFAQEGEPNEFTLAKALKQFDAVGGEEKLGKDEVLARVALSRSEWNEISTFLAIKRAKAQATPYDDPRYRDGATGTARSSAAASTGPAV